MRLKWAAQYHGVQPAEPLLAGNKAVQLADMVEVARSVQGCCGIHQAPCCFSTVYVAQLCCLVPQAALGLSCYVAEPGYDSVGTVSVALTSHTSV